MEVIDIGLHNLKVWVARVILVISLHQNVRPRPTYKETRELYCQLDHWKSRTVLAYVLFCVHEKEAWSVDAQAKSKRTALTP
jgi:hypothetical protein